MPGEQGHAPTDGSVLPLDRLSVMPTKLVVETTFVRALLDEDAPEHGVASKVLADLIRAETRLFFDDLTELDVHDLAFEFADRVVLGGPDGRLPRQTGPAASTLARAVLSRWRAVRAESDAVHVELREVIGGFLYFMEHYGLSAPQAIQANLVLSSGAAGIVTLDTAFAAVDESLLRIFTVESVLRRFPARRARGASML